MNQPLLQLSGITSGYGDAMVIRDVSLNIEPGQILALLGKNGMGKSTLLKTVMGYLPAASGTITYSGENITGLAPHRFAKRAVAYSPQEKAIFQDLTIHENLVLGLTEPKLFNQRFAHIAELFPILGQRLGQQAGTLSGGEQKMLLVARALLAQPRLILIDEITEGLQPSVIERLAIALQQERKRTGVAILLVEQHIPFALSVADRWAVLKLGEIDETGKTQDEGASQKIAAHFAV